MALQMGWNFRIILTEKETDCNDSDCILFNDVYKQNITV